MATPVYKISLPWLLERMGLAPFLRHVIHCPDAELPAVVAATQQELQKLDPTSTVTITGAIIRAVEAVQQELVSSGIPDVTVLKVASPIPITTDTPASPPTPGTASIPPSTVVPTGAPSSAPVSPA